MRSLWSYILWEKLGNSPNDYKIHQKSYEQLAEDFKKYIEEKGAEQFKKDVEEVSAIPQLEESDFYYDGPFYQFKFTIDKSVIEEDPENENRVTVPFLFHHTEIDPWILHLMMEYMDPSSVDLLAAIHREYYKNKKAEVTLDESNNSGQ